MTQPADEKIRHQDGSEHHIRRRREAGARGEHSFIIRVVGPEGLTREVWHEVMDHRGQVIHRHATFRRAGDDA
jgi:hypothetical protein